MTGNVPFLLDSADWSRFLSRQRWFAGHGRDVAAPPSFATFAELAPGLWGVLVDYAGDRYFVPVVVAPEADPLVTVQSLPDGRALLDAPATIPGARALAAALFAAGEGGSFPVSRIPGVAAPGADAGVRLGPADQTNSWCVVGDVFLKVFRRPVPGENLDVQVLRALVGSEAPVPRFLGSVSGPRAETLVSALERIVADASGWETACAQVAEAVSGGSPDSGLWRTLGQNTASLHRTLALCGGEFEPVPLTAEALSEHGRSAAKLAREVGADLAASAVVASEPELSARVLAALPDLVARLEAPLEGCDTARLRVHGDYHLGQVLRTSGEFVILDFEGEPSRPDAQRRELHPAAKDVAGMLRSFDYAARAGLPPCASPEALARAATWRLQARSAFLEGWGEGVAGSRATSGDPVAERALRDRYELEKAFYELRYELGHRPDWAAIPLSGLAELAGER